MIRILGIDPALNKTGWALIEIGSENILKFVASGVVKINIRESLIDKLRILSQEITNIVDLYSPDEVAIEEVFVNKNPLTSMKLGHARGAIITSCLKNKISIYEYGANKIKKSVCGVGKAEKQQVAMMVKVLLPKAQFQYDDESDALAVAICHVHHRKF